jgi:hypothetical protein
LSDTADTADPSDTPDTPDASDTLETPETPEATEAADIFLGVCWPDGTLGIRIADTVRPPVGRLESDTTCWRGSA